MGSVRSSQGRSDESLVGECCVAVPSQRCAASVVLLQWDAGLPLRTAAPMAGEWRAQGWRGGSPLGVLDAAGTAVRSPNGTVGCSAPPLVVDWRRFEVC
jgi:hypothetical protein